MDSVNLFKGYDRVETQNSQPRISRKPLSIAITISAVLLFTLVIASTLAGLVLVPIIKDSPDSPSLSSDSISILCNVTRYPDSCFTALSSLNASSLKPDPRTFLNLSLQVAITHLHDLTFSLKSLNDLPSQPALSDCVSLFDDALSGLNDSVSAMKVGLTKEKISDIQTWISSALSDQDTCNDGLEEMGSRVDDKVKSQFQSCKESISNSLAIIAHMQILLQKFRITMN